MVMSDNERPLDVVTCEQRSAGRVMQIFRVEQSKTGMVYAKALRQNYEWAL